MVVQPVYEVIKKEDLAAAFADALAIANVEVLERLNNLIDLYAATASSSLWTWDNTSRMDYDMWW
ncbi:unnamed protein product [marine sediment metagenome]|uniref:Uncharacterized protein n=1 Tax=marine sediment metagenome TaxID=412755 RepID=X1MWS4_9ZZZZ